MLSNRRMRSNGLGLRIPFSRGFVLGLSAGLTVDIVTFLVLVGGCLCLIEFSAASIPMGSDGSLLQL